MIEYLESLGQPWYGLGISYIIITLTLMSSTPSGIKKELRDGATDISIKKYKAETLLIFLAIPLWPLAIPVVLAMIIWHGTKFAAKQISDIFQGLLYMIRLKNEKD